MELPPGSVGQRDIFTQADSKRVIAMRDVAVATAAGLFCQGSQTAFRQRLQARRDEGKSARRISRGACRARTNSSLRMFLSGLPAAGENAVKRRGDLLPPQIKASILRRSAATGVSGQIVHFRSSDSPKRKSIFPVPLCSAPSK